MRRYSFPGARCAFVVGFCCFTHLAVADFQSGVERFNGTTKDLNTWEEMAVYMGSSVGQNNALLLHAPYVADYTTRQLKIGIGQGVRAEVTMQHNGLPLPGYDAFAELCLTTNSGGTTQHLHMDSSVIKMALHSYFQAVEGAETHFGNGEGNWVVQNIPVFETTYIFNIRRLSSTLAEFWVNGPDGTELGRNTKSLTGVPDDLFIGMRAQSADVTFDNVSIFPEPTALLVPALAGMLLRRRRPG